MQKIQYLENQNKYTREEIEDFQCTEKPMFLGPLQGPDVLWENQSCHFETSRSFCNYRAFFKSIF